MPSSAAETRNWHDLLPWQAFRATEVDTSPPQRDRAFGCGVVSQRADAPSSDERPQCASRTRTTLPDGQAALSKLPSHTIWRVPWQPPLSVSISQLSVRA